MTQSFLPFSRPAILPEDIEAVVAVLESGWITTGPRSAELEAAFCERLGARHAIAVTSATAGMHLYLHALGIGPGDEVITPSMTWVSTVNLIRLSGAQPVFVDVDRDTLMVSAESLASALSERTRLIIPVHFAGAPLDIEPIRALAERAGVAIVEDAAHALGSACRGTEVGHAGTAIFSLQAIKNVTGAEGGVVVTDDDALAERLRRLRFHGLAMDSHDRSSQGRAPQAEVVEPGFKYNLPDLCASLALNQMARLDAINDRRRALARHYLQRLAGVREILPLGLPAWPHRHAWHLFAVRLNCAWMSRERFMAALQDQGIGTGIHFRAVHSQRYYLEHPPIGSSELPNTDWNSERICSLPLFPAMTDVDVDRVVATIERVLVRP